MQDSRPTIASTPAETEEDIEEAIPVADTDEEIPPAPDRVVQFVPHAMMPDETHHQLLLEALEQMFTAEAHALYLDPGSESVRMSVSVAAGTTDLAALPLPVGRLVIEALRREAALQPADLSPGSFARGVLRIFHQGVERRLRVDLVPTVFGSAAVLRLMASLPPVEGDLKTIGFSDSQVTVIEPLITSGSGLFLVGGPDREWGVNTVSMLLSKSASYGRRACLVAPRPGADISGVARVETKMDDKEIADAIRRVADAGYACIGLESILAPDIARAAAEVAAEHKVLVVGSVTSRSAPEAIGQFYALGLNGTLAATLSMATCQLQLPLLCGNCARWGDVAVEDVAYFGLDPSKKSNCNIRNGCATCNGQVLDFAQIFEICAITDAMREKMRIGAPFAKLESDLITAPGYVRLLHRFGEAIQEGRCSPPEAKQYYLWQMPSAAKSAGSSGGNLKAV